MDPRLSDLESLILLALIRLGDEGYGVAVQKELASRSGRAISFGSIYTTLARLEARGLVASRLGDPTPERGGRRKRYFEIRPAGRRAVAASLKVLRAMTRGLGPSLEVP
jgi:PadR family transcriptional regulator PadR